MSSSADYQWKYAGGRRAMRSSTHPYFYLGLLRMAAEARCTRVSAAILDRKRSVAAESVPDRR
jgi:hypothetical protein